jgi:hypothetical protein
MLHNLIPAHWRTAARNILPKEWILPERLTIKAYTEESLCTEEGKVYSHLSRLQGEVVPVYYGVGDFCHAGKTLRAHIIEEVHETPLKIAPTKYGPSPTLRTKSTKHTSTYLKNVSFMVI